MACGTTPRAMAGVLMSDNTHAVGNRGEDAACRYLEGKGYLILDRNYRAERYEIDIVAQKDDTVIFCEVKTARTKKFGEAVTWVTPEKIRRIADAAQEYISARFMEEPPCKFRFDVIGIEIDGDEARINHIENAFSAPEDTA